MIVNADKMMTAQMRKMMRAMQQQGGVEEKEPPVKLQINPRHPLIKISPPFRQGDSELAQMISSQILDNARMAAGLLEDRYALQRNYGILEKLSAQ